MRETQQEVYDHPRRKFWSKKKIIWSKLKIFDYLLTRTNWAGSDACCFTNFTLEEAEKSEEAKWEEEGRPTTDPPLRSTLTVERLLAWNLPNWTSAVLARSAASSRRNPRQTWIVDRWTLVSYAPSSLWALRNFDRLRAAISSRRRRSAMTVREEKRQTSFFDLSFVDFDLAL